MATEPRVFRCMAPCVDAIVAKVGKDIHLGLPLGLGKAMRLVNALYRRACEDKSINLHIATALSLEKPVGASSLEKRFLQPFVERLWGDVPDLDYIGDVHRGTLPGNVRVSEFFFKAGSTLDIPGQQQNYICTNYTHAVRDLLALGVNVIGQMISPHPTDSGVFSLASNTDLSLDLIPLLREREAEGQGIAVVGEVNPQMPYMSRHAEISADTFDFILEGPHFDYGLFPVPATEVAPADHMIGLYASALIRDGGTLQVGIGSLGTALVCSTVLRHQRNDLYRSLLKRLSAAERFPVIAEVGGEGAFEVGLYGCSEILVDGFVQLHEAGILKREVFEDESLQLLLNEEAFDPRPSLAMLDRLLGEALIESPWRARDHHWLQRFGIVKPEVTLKGGLLHVGQEAIKPDLKEPQARHMIETHVLGECLTGGVILHGGFFLGPRAFYQYLRDLPESERQKFCMTSVNFINHLYDHAFGKQALKVAQRRDSRFINSAMVQTLNGAANSDGLEDGRVVSGVGGQYNFVAMAHDLPGARSILTLRSTRHSGGETVSNIVFNYGHVTIPRHLRDIVVTEYGIADLRGKSDQEIYQALIQIADSRFQGDLLRQAKKAGKIAKCWTIPQAFRDNRPQKIAALVKEVHQESDIFGPFPFDCPFSADELRLTKALKALKAATRSRYGKLRMLGMAMRKKDTLAHWQPLLTRMDLAQVSGLRQKLDRRLLLQGLAMTED